MKPTIQPFIFNWKRQYDKACVIEDQLLEIFPKVTVINSDDDNTRPGWIDIGDQCFFGSQFRKALELFTGEIFFHVQADIEFDKWRKLVNDAKFYFRYYDAGIYAPNIDYSYYTPERTDFTSDIIDHSNIRCVGSTDETVWFVRKEVINGLAERRVDLSMNELGWGWDSVLAAISFAKGMPVLRDYRYTVSHPAGTGYDWTVATQQMDALVAALDDDLKEIHSYIRGDRQQLTRYLKRQPQGGSTP